MDSPAKAFCLEGDPKAVSSTAHRTEQAPAPARELRHFIRVRMNVSETTGPSETGAKHCVRSAKNQLDRGPLTTPKQPLAPPLALPTPAENGGPSETAVRSETGAQAPRVQCACAYVIAPILPFFTPFLPHFYPMKGKMPRFYPVFTPLHLSVFTLPGDSRVKPLPHFTPVLPHLCRVKCQLLPRFYPVATFYPAKRFTPTLPRLQYFAHSNYPVFTPGVKRPIFC